MAGHGGMLVLVAARTDKQLGISLSGSPPNPVCVRQVEPQSLAERTGVEVGDELLAVDGRPIGEMAREDLVGAMRHRPLSLNFAVWEDTATVRWPGRTSVMVEPEGTLVVVASQLDTKLGWSPSGMPPNRIWVEEVDSESWADRMGIARGDELIAVNGRPAMEMVRKDFLTAMRRRPLRLCFVLAHHSARGGSSGMADPEGVVVLIARDSDRTLGWAPSALPPNRIFVKSVEPDSWAFEMDLEVGDELVAVNGRLVVDMDREDLLDAMKQRPLRLAFEMFDDSAAEIPFSVPAGAAPRRHSSSMLTYDEQLAWARRESLAESPQLPPSAAAAPAMVADKTAGVDHDAGISSSVLTASCDICFLPYAKPSRTPKGLPCGHTFCGDCVSRLPRKAGLLRCPTCREEASTHSVRPNFALCDVLFPGESVT